MALFVMHPPMAFVLGVLGNIISFLVYLAPLPTFLRIYQKKSTENFQSVPYICALFSATLWLYYGLIKPGCILLVTVNTVGCIIETFYLAVFLKYATPHAKMVTAKFLLLLNVGVLGCVLAFTMLFSHGHRRILIVGWFGSATSAIVYAAPLSILRFVILTKSVEFMPFYLSLFLTINATIWFSYGISIHDWFVALPNVLGFLFGTIQMTVYILYKKRSSNNGITIDDTKATGNEHPTVVKPNSNSCEVHPIDVHSSPSSSSQRPNSASQSDKL